MACICMHFPFFFFTPEKPGFPTIGQSDIQTTSLTVKWTAPADDGGSPITAFRVVILMSGTEIKDENVTDPSTTSLPVGGLEMDTEYTVKVFARNAVFEGSAGEKTVKTKYEGNKMGCLVVGCFAYHLSFDDESSSTYFKRVLKDLLGNQL